MIVLNKFNILRWNVYVNSKIIFQVMLLKIKMKTVKFMSN